jgi:hypothetical protein
MKFVTDQQQHILNKILFEVRHVWPKINESGLPTIYRVLLHSKMGGTGKSMISRLVTEKTGGVLLSKKLTSLQSLDFIPGEINIFHDDEFDCSLKKKSSSGNFAPRYGSYEEELDVKSKLHSVLDLSGEFSILSNIIVLCMTNDIEFIKKEDPTLLSRFDLVEEMYHLTEYEASQFAKSYARDSYDLDYNFSNYSETTNLRDVVRDVNQFYLTTLRS